MDQEIGIGLDKAVAFRFGTDAVGSSQGAGFFLYLLHCGGIGFVIRRGLLIGAVRHEIGYRNGDAYDQDDQPPFLQQDLD